MHATGQDFWTLGIIGLAGSVHLSPLLILANFYHIQFPSHVFIAIFSSSYFFSFFSSLSSVGGIVLFP